MRWTDETARKVELAIGFGLGDQCPCGCGADTELDTKTYLQRFRPGHDARLISQARQAIRENKVTSTEAIEYLRFQDRDKLADKLAAQLLNFPKNGPTRKAARALIAAMPMNNEQKWIEQICGSINPNHQYHTGTETDCALHLVLNDWTASDVFRRFS